MALPPALLRPSKSMLKFNATKNGTGYLGFKFIRKLTLIFKKWGQYLLLQNAPGSYFVSSKGGLNFKATQPKFIFLKCINLSHFASVLALQAPFRAALRYSYEGKIYLLCKRCRHLAKVRLYHARNS